MKTLAAIATTLALALAGCGDDDSGSESSGSSSSTPATPSGGVSADAVEIKGFAFNPKDVTVKVGQKITWTNADSAPHDVVADDGAFKSDTLETGDTFEYTADAAGSFAYICSIHPQMKATLTVE